LGLFVLFSSISLLAHAIRPMRRSQDGSGIQRFDRVADYVMPPVFLGLAANSMYEALNGLSGLKLVEDSQFDALTIIVIVFFVIRMLLEDLALHSFPERSAICQPGKLSTLVQWSVWGTIVVKLGLFILIAAPFFGFSKSTYLAFGLTAAMMVLKVYKQKLPNFAQIHKWYPRGIANVLFSLVVGAYVGNYILGSDPSKEKVISTLALMMVPGIIFTLIEMFGREGGIWPDSWKQRIAGTVVWLATVGIVLGFISL